MPDWSYRTFLRPVLLARGEERGRTTAVRALRMLSRLPFGKRLIDFMGHMRADPRLRTPLGEATLAGPVILGATIDPSGDARRAGTIRRRHDRARRHRYQHRASRGESRTCATVGSDCYSHRNP